MSHPPHPLGQRPALDGVRAIAILAVMALHAASDYFPGGYIGVDIFFALSAFLITALILEAAEPGRYDFVGFYVRRALRLGPALLLWLVFVAGPTALLAGEGDRIVGSTLAALLYIGNYALAFGWLPVASAHEHMWSLAIEEQFYLLWPALLVFAVLPLARPRRVLTLAALTSAGVYVLTQRLVDHNYLMPSGHIVALSAGCLAAHLAVYGPPSWVHRALTPTLPWLVLGAVAIFVVHPVLPTLGVAAISLGVAALLLQLVVRPGARTTGLLSTAPLLWLGRRSYGLYLYHRTLAETLPLLVPGIRLKLAGPLVLVLSCVLAELSFRLVERPVQQAGRRRLSRSRRTAREPVESAHSSGVTVP